MKSYHVVFEHNHEKTHQHDELSFCDHNIEVCLCNYLFNPVNNLTYTSTSFIFFNNDIYTKNFFENSLFFKTIYELQKERGPPWLYFFHIYN